MSEGRTANRFTVFGYRSDKAGHGPMLYGFAVLVPLLLVAGGWSVLAPLNAAAIADGKIVLNYDRKVVQHLEGGMVDALLVEEGQSVKVGDPIIVIRDIAQRTEMNTLYEQLAAKRAHRARLLAERDGLERPDFASLGEAIELDRARLESLADLQSGMFENRSFTLKSKIDIIRSRQLQTEDEIDGLEAQLAAAQKRIALLSEELIGVTDLAEKGYSTRTRKLELQKQIAELEGEAGAHRSDIAQLRQANLSADLEVIDLQNERRTEVLESLQSVEPEVQELTHRLVATRDELKRTVITSPASGRVLDLQVKTVGAVVNPGARILDVVPEDDRMIIEARVLPTDIDLVAEGTPAKVMLTAYKANKVPKIDAVLENLSADIHVDEATGESYFLARVAVDETLFEKLKADVTLYPGMPVQVFFLEDGRTVADYLLSPVFDAAYRAFREE